MNIFNIFKKKNKQSESSNKEITTIKNIESLFQTPLDERNEFWIDEFNTSISHSNFTELNPIHFEDKMGMNYLNLTLNNEGNSNIEKFIDSCLQTGKGISINGQGQASDWIFTFGELLDFHMNGIFYSNQISEPFTGKVIDRYFNNKEATIGQPSEKFFPQIARFQIKSFLKTFGLENSKIALIWWRENNRITLSFEIIPEMFQNPTDDVLQSLLHSIKWYLPNHYDVIFTRGNEDFQEL